MRDIMFSFEVETECLNKILFSWTSCFIDLDFQKQHSILCLTALGLTWIYV